MNIKQLSEQTGLSPHTLRYYEKLGLLTAIHRNSSGYRSYSQQDVKLINKIKKLKDTGMSLADIKTYIMLYRQGDETVLDRVDLYIKQYHKVEREIAKLKQQAENMCSTIKLCKKTLQIKK